MSNNASPSAEEANGRTQRTSVAMSGGWKRHAPPSADTDDLDIEVQPAPGAVGGKRGNALQTRSSETGPVAQTESLAPRGRPVATALQRAPEVKGQDLPSQLVERQGDFRFDPAILMQARGDLGGIDGRGRRVCSQGFRNEVGAGLDKDDGKVPAIGAAETHMPG